MTLSSSVTPAAAAHHYLGTSHVNHAVQLISLWLTPSVVTPVDVLQGHGDTDYDRWFNASQLYTVNITSLEYEPWFIIGRHQVPLYDVRYRGYG
jgi:hypothetical protein